MYKFYWQATCPHCKYTDSFVETCKSSDTNFQ